MNATFIFIKSFDSVLEVVSQSAISSSILEGLMELKLKKSYVKTPEICQFSSIHDDLYCHFKCTELLPPPFQMQLSSSSNVAL